MVYEKIKSDDVVRCAIENEIPIRKKGKNRQLKSSQLVATVELNGQRCVLFGRFDQ
jgi:hypothetical protein